MDMLPCQNDKKMTLLTVQNLSTGSNGVKSQEADGVGLPDQATGAVQATGAYRLAPDLGHDVPLTA
ncbi:hypothetical protein DBV15_02168 [Temnothorax longispinosus]|uniref:Uncharacterized protein n=1 Tax=Temnothorax longispinosus TaxID=300112 RepID=A0A4S2JNX8_9HYME|nr:hypothetical protein DBV15_02168 [Temnothorax longispinosus]